MSLKFKNTKIIDVSGWDALVEKTYNRPYSFQQQDGCKERQHVRIRVPVKDPEDYENDTVPEIVNDTEMGVSFKAWLERDPEQKLNHPDHQSDFDLGLWWGRNFYPHEDMIINDLHAKGLLEAGEYEIDIDW